MRESHRDNQVHALTTHQLQVEMRESHRDNQMYALTTHQLQVERRESHRDNQMYAFTTHQLQVERRESVKSNQIKSLLLSHHHSTSALVSEILMSVLQTVQKKQQTI